MTIEKEWEIKLIEEARKVIAHGWGSMEFTVSKGKSDIRIAIKAGKCWVFEEITT